MRISGGKMVKIHREKWLGFMLFLVMIVSGCGVVIPSELSAFPEGAAAVSDGASIGIQVASPSESVDARAAIEEAIRYTNEHLDTQKFWYTGFVRNTMEQHLVNSMFDGVVIRPKDAVLINARIAGQPFQYYSYEGEHYVRNNQVWYPVVEERPLPLDPLAGFEAWLPLMEEAVALPNTNVLGIPARAYEVRITGKTWIESAPTALFDELRAEVQSDEMLEQLLEQTIVKTTLKIGIDEPIIYEYETWIVMPLPSGGYFDQLTYVRLYRYNDPSIERMIPTTAEIRDWVSQFEKQMEAELEGQ